MLRGLIIRRAFTLVDLALGILMAVVAYQVVALALAPADPDLLDPAGHGAGGGAAAFEPRQTDPRHAYDVLASNPIFGNNSMLRTEGKPQDTEPEPQAEQPEAAAPSTLRLLGTTTIFPTDPLASAQIENANARTVQKIDTYFVGDEVTDSHVLMEVHPRKVILRNTRLNRLEVLEQAAEDKTVVASAPGSRGTVGPEPPSPPASGRSMSRGHATVSRDEVVEAMATRGAELIQTAKPRMYVDENGNVAGITSDNLSAVPLAQKVGLKDGDVVQSVNGVDIDSQESIAEIFSRFENATVFRLGVMRGGQQQVLNVRLE